MTEYKCVVCNMPLLTTNDKWLLQNERIKSEWIARCVHGNCVMCQVWLPLEALDEIERLQARVQELEQERRWIPVSEKENLPDVGVEILGWEVRRQRYVLDWLANREMLSKKEPTFLFSFDYWQPLPQPPKERE